MISPEIITYIKSEKAKNVSESIIKSNLISNGWTANDVEEAFASLSTPISTTSPISINIEHSAYQKKIKFTIFIILSSLFFLSIITSLFTLKLNYSIQILFTSLVDILIAYVSAAIVSKGARPKDAKWKNVLDLIIRLIGASFIFIFIFLTIAFATCALIIGMGGNIF